ncbi:MAG: hypothetical protein M3N35_04035, partial [Candidatus Binatota bacterium]|nr:hypothetical protein [Candidatus Binatota bacterium]
MSGKSIPTELSPAASLAGRLFFFLNFKRLKVWLWWLALLAIAAAAIFVEFQTSLLQSWFFTSTNERLFYSIKDGPSREIMFPRAAAPFDERRGCAARPSREKSSYPNASSARLKNWSRSSQPANYLSRAFIAPSP